MLRLRILFFIEISGALWIGPTKKMDTQIREGMAMKRKEGVIQIMFRFCVYISKQKVHDISWHKSLDQYSRCFFLFLYLYVVDVSINRA